MSHQDDVNQPSHHTRLRLLEHWVEQHQRKSLRHTTYFWLLSSIVIADIVFRVIVK